MVQNDIEYYKLQYQIPLQNGGQNTPENLKLICLYNIKMARIDKIIPNMAVVEILTYKNIKKGK